MKQGRTLTQLAAELERQATSKEDYTVDTRSLEIATESSGASTLRTSGGEIPDAPVLDIPHEQIAERLKVQLTQVENMEARLSGPDQSANAPIGEDGGSEWQDLLVDDGPSPEDRIQRNNDNAVRSRWLKTALTRLPARDQHIIQERHLKEEATTLADLGAELGISKERVRQIEAAAFQKMRRYLEKNAGEVQSLLA